MAQVIQLVALTLTCPTCEVLLWQEEATCTPAAPSVTFTDTEALTSATDYEPL